jgi:hypothetical protein
MKSIALLFSLLLALPATAELKPEGTFVPSECTFDDQAQLDRPAVDVVAVESLCVGKLSGLNQAAIELNLNDGTSRLYTIEAIKIKKPMGAERVKIKGEAADGSGETITGFYNYSSGIRRYVTIEIETSGNLEFEGELQLIMTTL